MSIGFNRPSDATSFGASTQRTSADFVQLGFTDGMRPPIQISQAFASIGYRVLAGIAQSTRLVAGISAKNDRGTYGLKVGGASDVTAVRGSAIGGLAFLGGNTFAAQRITDGFAVVNVPRFANVRVFAGNQLIGTTDENRHALVPRRRPYQRNAIRIDESDLPLDARIDATRLDGAPYFRRGIIMRVPVKKSRGGIIPVALETGEISPAGAIAQVVGSDETFPSGRRGEIYLTGLGK